MQIRIKKKIFSRHTINLVSAALLMILALYFIIQILKNYTLKLIQRKITMQFNYNNKNNSKFIYQINFIIKNNNNNKINKTHNFNKLMFIKIIQRIS